MVKEIPLTQGKVALVDDDDYEMVVTYKWCAHKVGHTFYAVRTEGVRSLNQKTIAMHRQIICPEKELDVDHINGNGLDNRRCNMRPATRSQNSANARNRKISRSGYIGVCFEKRTNKWSAGIKIKDKRKGLGTYQTPEDAARAYDEAAKKYHGEFARLNFQKSRTEG